MASAPVLQPVEGTGARCPTRPRCGPTAPARTNRSRERSAMKAGEDLKRREVSTRQLHGLVHERVPALRRALQLEDAGGRLHVLQLHLTVSSAGRWRPPAAATGLRHAGTRTMPHQLGTVRVLLARPRWRHTAVTELPPH